MKNQINTLRQYIFDHSNKRYRKETVECLLRAVLEPLLTEQNMKACVLLRINDTENKKSLLKRLLYSQSNIFSYNDKLADYNIKNSQIANIWEETEFMVILAQRYNAALIWDYNTADNRNFSDICLLLNSKIIASIARKIAENSAEDIKEFIHSTERRENKALNAAVCELAAQLNNKTEDALSLAKETKHFSSDNVINAASIIADKAKFIAHEIKNNLSVINLYASIAQKRFNNMTFDVESRLPIENAIKNILNASENVSALTADLRCLSSPYITEVNIKRVILNTVMMCEAKAQKAGVGIIVNDFDDCIIQTDKTKTACALTNIIYNAIEACRPNCRITIDCIQKSDKVHILIKNNGDMIPLELQQKIFEREFTTKPKGNGLGLAICKMQLESINGSINLVHSNKAETLFEIVYYLK